MKRVYVIGDSISIDYGPHLQQALQGVMEYDRKRGEAEARLNLDIPTGANGGDSGMVRRFLEGMAATGGIACDLLLVNCGLHDIKTDPTAGTRQVPEPEYEANLRAIVTTAAAMGPQMVWVRTTPCDENVHNAYPMNFHRFAADNQNYNAIADRVMAETGVPVIDLYTFTLNIGPDIYRDHAHFHPHVCEKQAAFIAGWLSGFAARQKP